MIVPAGRTTRAASDSPAASVVIPTYARRDSLLRVLRALGHQRIGAGSFEVIVVCDGDIDGTVQACNALASETTLELRIVEQANQGPAAARNRGVAEARAPLIIFVDDDVVPDAGLLDAHFRAQDGQAARVTIGPLLPPPDQRLSPWCTWEERALLKQYAKLASGRWEPGYRHFYTGNASVLQRHVVEAGGFDATFRRGEDVELGFRLRERGLHFVFLPHASARHYAQRSFASWLAIATAYGAADYAMALAGNTEILDVAAQEFWQRSSMVRGLVARCVGRRAVVGPTIAALGGLIRLTSLLGASTIGSYPCALVFNLGYYDALATALGGRAALMQLIAEPRLRRSCQPGRP